MFESQIRKLVKLVEESDIAQLEVTRWGRKVKIIKRFAPGSNGHGKDRGATEINVPAVSQRMEPAPVSAPSEVSSPPPAAVPQQKEPAPVAEKTESADDNYVPVKSPMVGTFYISPEPSAPPYVEVGGNVQKGTVVCIVEAMKLMNEIESEVSGKVVKRLVENGQPVEFGQTLFLVDPI
jgi:acetyl-CoA carboxylase biotin carboxyl carrier protein